MTAENFEKFKEMCNKASVKNSNEQ
jgi:hypothetical protein